MSRNVVRTLAITVVLLLNVLGQSFHTVGTAEAQRGDESDGEKLGTSGETANFTVLIKDILGKPRHGRVVVRNLEDQSGNLVPAVDGMGTATLKPGPYAARIEVYDGLVPYVVSIKKFTIDEGEAAFLDYELLEGATGGRPLSAFDQDNDLVIDGAEIALGSDPADPMSIPGVRTFRWPAQVMSRESGWVRGELHAHSEYGVGTESVSRVVKRAERAGLDFLAILDRNTLGPALDEDYTSKTMVMIPGMEWGDDKHGVALVYAPGTRLPEVSTNEEMDAYARLIQEQGGLVFAGHPCFPTSPWNRKLSHLNGVQGWCMGWRAIPPMATGHLMSQYLERLPDTEFQGEIVKGDYVFPIARAANIPGLSANGQATAFWNYEMSYGRHLTLIGGSQSGTKSVEIGEPLTYVYAQEKSLKGILEGLRLGRTYVSSGVDGPKIEWMGDMFDDGSVDVSIGGVVPIDHPTKYFVRVRGAQGKKLEVMINGVTSLESQINGSDWIYPYVITPEHYEVYTVRVVEKPDSQGFGFTNVLAMTSPIYAQGIVQDNTVGNQVGTEGWVKIENEYVAPAQIDAFVEQLKANSRSQN